MSRVILTSLAAMLATGTVHAHFVWIALESAKESADPSVYVYFGESASPDSSEFLDRLTGLKAWRRGKEGEYVPLTLDRTEHEGVSSLAARLPPGTSCVEADCLYGVFSRGQKNMLLHYYAKSLTSTAGENLARSSKLDLDVVPRCSGGELELNVLCKGKPAAGAQVTLRPPAGDASEVEADAKGLATFKAPAPGKYEIRARVIEAASGEHDQEKYGEVRHYVTLTYLLASLAGGPAGGAAPASAAATDEATPVAASKVESVRLADLPRGITSFGAAVIDDWMYVYGGHQGRPHHYFNGSQSETLSRLHLERPGEWEVIARGPGLQGLAMVAHGGKLYRAGGFRAENEEGKEEDLRSVADFVRFDPVAREWEALPSLPEPRSSHDIVLAGDKLYVAGGWQLKGAEKLWHTTAWVMDLARDRDELTWEKLPDPPFQRRALSLAYLDGKLVVIGGMQQKGGPTTRVDILDLGAGVWSQGPSLPGEGMEGFGSSASTVGRSLFVSTHGGNLLRLDAGATEWKLAAKLEDDRFFHRMLPHDGKLLLVGGASMVSGKRLHFETVDLSEVK
jgi:hypothetical protein